MTVVANTMVFILQFRNVSNQQVVSSKLTQCNVPVVSQKNLEKRSSIKIYVIYSFPEDSFHELKWMERAMLAKSLWEITAKKQCLVHWARGSTKTVEFSLDLLTPGYSHSGNKSDQNTSLGSSYPVWVKPNGRASPRRVGSLGMSKCVCVCVCVRARACACMHACAVRERERATS